ncbi:MAG TPA: M1 family aminopeptidase [Candidatus Dormibacteraeota bacterium]|nr:M1 family aminopeptidase [Candidatus Dormibacteraeota bacterium]
MIGLSRSTVPRRVMLILWIPALLVSAMLLMSFTARADEPYARTRDYDLQHSRIVLRFDLDDRKVIGNVTHSLAVLRGGTSKLSFDSANLKISSVTVNGKTAKFETAADKLLVSLSHAARAGEKVDVAIRYEGHPKKGLYFVLPDKDYPNRPKQIWTQGESEDTRYYLPTYDYPNDRLTTEMIVTVPKDWVTVSNGKLIRVDDTPDGMKVWDWKESVPSSTYLISLVAGEFDEVKESWRGIPVTYYAPKGRGDRLKPNYGATRQMLDFFSKRLGVNYPWEKYAQSMVDDFVAGGMENSSATTNTSSSLVDPRIAPEFVGGQDTLISHELAHQWFGDFLTCKDWGNIWLNEGFATFMAAVWNEQHYGVDAGAHERWEAARQWAADRDLFPQPLVRHNFDDSSEFDGNAYGKGAWVLYMLKHQLGEEAFWRGMKHYLEKFHGQNVTTSDYAEAMEESTGVNLDQFFDQWVYGAGAPNFDLRYTYDSAKHEVKLEVKQTQKIEGRVGMFSTPVEVEIATASGSKSFPITVSKDDETFTFAVGSAPLMVLFDKNLATLKIVDFHKKSAELIYQLQHAAAVPDRLDAAQALGKTETSDQVVSALGTAAMGDSAWGVRLEALKSLGQIAGPAALKQIIAALGNDQPWVKQMAVQQLGNFSNDAEVAAKLAAIASDDKSYRARAAALGAIAKVKAPRAYDVLQAAMAIESPDEILRRAALRAFAALGADKAIPMLLDWAAPGKPLELRQAAISSLGRLDKKNKEITKGLEGFLNENHFPIRLASVFALGERGDPSAIPALSAMLKSDDLSIAFAPTIEAQIQRLKQTEGKSEGKPPSSSEQTSPSSKSGPNQPILLKLENLEKIIAEMSERLKSVEKKLVADKK